jgi:hypothetical protein
MTDPVSGFSSWTLHHAAKVHARHAALAAKVMQPSAWPYPHSRNAPLCPKATRGEDQRHAKLTERAVQQIRWRHREGDATVGELATTYGVKDSTIASVLARRSWTHVVDRESLAQRLHTRREARDAAAV